eukprot:8122697-Lingulodinium_polyedra.AAC.1
MPGRAPLLVASVYLMPGAGFSPGNLQVLASILATAERVQLPYMLLGDWNIGADTMAGARIIAQLGARVWAPGAPTCITKKSSSCVDYALIHSELEPI